MARSPDDLPAVLGQRMIGDTLAADIDAQSAILAFLDEHEPAGLLGSHTVTGAAIGQHPLAADQPVAEVARIVVRPTGQGMERCLLGWPTVPRALVRRAMDAQVRCLAQPDRDRPIQLAQRQGFEVQTQQEIAAQIANAALDLALGLRPIRLAGARHKAVVIRKVLEAPIPDHTAVGRAMVHGGLEIVVEQLVHDATEVLKGMYVAAEESFQVLTDGELDVLPAAVAQRQHKR